MIRPCHWAGEVLAVRQLGNIVIVYGDDGIAGLFPSAQYLGYKPLSGAGIYCKGAVGCGDDKHVFLGSDMKLRSVDENMTIKLLDFYEDMSQLTGTVHISYDSHSKDFYISDGVRCFILAGEKLYECHQLISSARSYGNSTLAAYYDTGVDYALCVTDTIDFGYRSKKTIFTIELGLDGVGDYSVYLS